jgi:hypothetical protein
MEKCEEAPKCFVTIGEDLVDGKLVETRALIKYPCGCETVKLLDEAIGVKPCELHKNDGYVWIASIADAVQALQIGRLKKC